MNRILCCAVAVLAGCGDSTLVLSHDDDAQEEVVDANASVSSELSSTRPLLSMGLGIISREQWGARAPGSCRRAQSPGRIVVHHVGGTVTNSAAWMKNYDTELRVNRGWCDLMYHFGVDEAGRIWEMVSTGVEGAHAPAANAGSVAIVLMGDYTNRSPTAAQVASLQKLFVALNQVYGIGLNRSAIVGHRQVGQTACPGNTAYPKLDAYVATARQGEPLPPPAPTGAQQVPFASPAFTATSAPLRLSSVSSRRLVDTRATGALPANVVTPVFNAGDVGNASAVSLGVALIQPVGHTFLSVSAGTGVAPTSTVNAMAGTVRANQTLVSLNEGVVSMRSVQNTHVVIDEQARFAATGKGFFPLGPTRLFDSRGGASLAAGETRALSVTGLGVSSSSVAVQVGLAAIPRGVPGFVSLIPCGEAPTTSVLNFDGSQVASSAALAPLTNGQLCVFSSANVDLVIDVAGAFDDGGASLTLAAPTRLLDTRDGQGGWKGFPTPGQVMRLELSQMSGWPGSAAIAFNLTGADALGSGFAQVWDCTGEPTHSNQNATPGAAVGTFGVVRSGGTLCVRTTAPQHVIIDLVGIYR